MSTLSVAQAIGQLGYQVRVVTLRGQASISVCGAAIQSLPCKRDGSLGVDGIRRARALIREFQPAGLICWGPQAVAAGPWVECGNHVPMTAIHTSSQELLKSAKTWMGRLPLSRFGQHFVRDGLWLDPIRSLLPGLSVERLPRIRSPEPPVDRSTEIKAMLNIPPHAKLVGTSAELLPGNRLKDYLWACDLMRCIRDDVYWLVIGEGHHGWRLNRYAGQLDVGDNLRMLGWHAQSAEVISALDVYVQPATFDDTCRGMSLAFSQGIPLVGLIHPLHRSFIHHGVNGFLVERGARNEIARCVNRLVSDESNARSYARGTDARVPQVLATPSELADCLLQAGCLPLRHGSQSRAA